MPRVLRDVSQRDLSTTILGHKVSFPVCIAPTAMQRMAHPEGEVATAKGNIIINVLYIFSRSSYGADLIKIYRIHFTRTRT